MAEVVAINLEIDSGQSVKEVKKLEDAIKEVNNTSSSLSVDEKFKTLNSTLDTTTATFGEMSQAIEAYKTIALNAGRESPVGQEALKRAAQLKDRIADLDREVDNLAQDGQALQGALQIGTGVVAGYQAFTSVTALLGVENEELMKTMVKLQAAMSLLQSIEQIRLATEKESQAMLFIKNAQTKIGIVLQKAYALAVGTGTKAMKSFRGALIATGLGALVVLIGTIIAKWDDWKDSILKIIRVAFYPFIKVLESLGVIENDLDRARQLNSEKQLKRIRQEQDALKEIQGIQEDNLRHEISVAKARGENTEELEKKLLQETANGALARIKLNQDEINEIMQSQKEGNEERLSELYDFIEADKKAIEKAKRDAELFRAKKETEERNKRQRNWEKRKQEIEKQNKERLDMERQLQDLIIANEKDDDVRAIAQMKLQHQRELDAIREKYGLQTELEKQLKIKQENDLKELVLEQRERANNDVELELIPLKNRLEKGLAMEKKYVDDTEEVNALLRESRLKDADNFANISGNIASLFAKNEKVQKANALVQIGIDTAKAISSLVAASNGNPLNLVTGGLAGFAQLTTGLASIFGNIAKAKQLLGASSGGAGGSGVTPPSFNNNIPTTVTTGTAPTGNNTGNGRTEIPTTKVVLVESELQAMQSRRMQVDTIATI